MVNLFQYGYADFAHFFRMLAANHVDIKDFIQGNSERILSEQRSKLCYPLFWFEDPDIDFTPDCYQAWTASFVILANAELDCWERQDYVLDFTQKIAFDFIKRFQKYAEDCKFEFDISSVSVRRIYTLTHDNDYGWRVNFSFKVTHELCDHSCKWLDKCPDCAMASFKWQNTIDQSFEGLEIENTTMPAEQDWQFCWTWQIDKQGEQTSTAEVPNITGSGDWLTICLKAKLYDDEGKLICCQDASAIFCKKKSCGCSVPYIYKNLKPYC